jgi:pimeloyl-ACP methyl ester carboxylesterase
MSRWDKLIEETEEYRRQGAVQAQLQLEGKFVFPADEVARVDLSREQWIRDVPWHDHVEEFLVCGARVRFVHLRPAAVNTGDSSDSSDLTKRSIVFLHGDGGWSYMWRKVR